MSDKYNINIENVLSKGENAIQDILNKKNINYDINNIKTINSLLNNIIKNELNNNNNNNNNNNKYDELYFNYIYQIIGDILQNKSLNIIIEDIKLNKIGWEHTTYSKTAARIKEQNDFICNPFEVEEGVFQCKKCETRRVFSYSKQDRASDEGTSVYCFCMVCKSKWRERG